MASIFDVAKYILVKTGKPVDTMKLQKLCFYSQAWRLAWTGDALFAQDFQAWANGPVCYDLFLKHRGRYSVTADSLGAGDEDELSPDEAQDVDAVLDAYGPLRGAELSEMTHSEDPWIEARGGRALGASCQMVITKESIKKYYTDLFADPEAVKVAAC